MTIPMYGTQYPQQGYGYYPGMGYPTAGYPASGYPTYPPQQVANAGGTDSNAILGTVIQPLMGLVMSLLTGTSTSDQQPCPDPSQDPGIADPGASGVTLAPDSETSDYLEVLNDKSNSKDLKALEKKFGKGVVDGKLTADELHKIVRAIEKGKKGTEDISEDLKTALTWLDKDETGKTVMINLSNEFDKEDNAAVDIRKGFDEKNIDDVDTLEEEPETTNAFDALTYLKEDQSFADKINGDDQNLSKAEIDDALKNKNYTAEEKAVLRMLRSHYDDFKEIWGVTDETGFSTDGSEKGALTTALKNDETKLEDMN